MIVIYCFSRSIAAQEDLLDLLWSFLSDPQTARRRSSSFDRSYARQSFTSIIDESPNTEPLCCRGSSDLKLAAQFDGTGRSSNSSISSSLDRPQSSEDVSKHSARPFPLQRDGQSSDSLSQNTKTDLISSPSGGNSCSTSIRDEDVEPFEVLCPVELQSTRLKPSQSSADLFSLSSVFADGLELVDELRKNTSRDEDIRSESSSPPYLNTVLCGYFSKIISSIYARAGEQVRIIIVINNDFFSWLLICAPALTC